MPDGECGPVSQLAGLGVGAAIASSNTTLAIYRLLQLKQQIQAAVTAFSVVTHKPVITAAIPDESHAMSPLDFVRQRWTYVQPQRRATLQRQCCHLALAFHGLSDWPEQRVTDVVQVEVGVGCAAWHFHSCRLH